jgi:hypothetical protein
MKRTHALGSMALLLTLAFTSCKKEDVKSDSDVQAAENNSMAESNYNDAGSLVDMSYTAGTNMSFRETNEEGMLSSCVTVTVDTVSSPRVITLDFGASNCMCIDGRNRRGKIIATYTGKYRDAGTVVNISFDNYFVNDNQIKGTHKTTNMGYNAAQHLVHKVEVNGQIVKANNGGTITWVSTREREWVAGANTPINILDDTYSITGNASGTNADGTSYTINITQALVRKMNCFWFESGKLDVTPSGRLVRTLDYGTSGCDNKATVTIAGLTFNVVLF